MLVLEGFYHVRKPLPYILKIVVLVLEKLKQY